MGAPWKIVRIYIEIVRNIRKKIGPDFPLTIRLSGTDYEPDGFPIEDTIVLSKVLKDEGIDAIHVSGGDHHTMIHQVSPMSMSICHNTWAAEVIKKEVDIPIIASGSITLPEYAEEIISTGKADFVGLGRPLWADPYWPQKQWKTDLRIFVLASDAMKDAWKGAFSDSKRLLVP